MFGVKPTPHRFWKWFMAHYSALYEFEKDQERLFDQLAEELQKIDPNLTFEFGPKIENKREFVISAGGIPSSFPAVLDLIRVAPTMEHWQITGFRPRRSPMRAIKLRGKSIDPAQVKFSLIDNGKDIGVNLFIPDYEAADATWREMGYLLLDEALGEYDIETKVGPIGMFPIDDPRPGERFPLSELPAIFDQHFLTLQIQSETQTQNSNSTSLH